MSEPISETVPFGGRIEPPIESPLSQLVTRLRAEPRLGGRIEHHLYLPGSEQRSSELVPPLHPGILSALGSCEALPLWEHQVHGIGAVRSKENVLVTTPTASGKSLIFQLPVIEEALSGGSGRALFLYPLKALGRDQKARFDELSTASGLSACCEIYDGDTPKAARARIRREPPRVLISNPDMVHLGMLPHWHAWETFLKELRWIVLDELHTYRGIFGSHFHHVLRRLLRLSRHVGGDPRIIASSATAANAENFAAELSGEEFLWIHDSGAPREARHFLLLQPESSPYTLALHLMISLLKEGQRTIVFSKARRITELLFKWLQRQEPELSKSVASYRAGFLPEERRQIEQDLFSGKLLGVVSTSALELGIDVGGLDACILVGYPGSMIATWQRSGRAGRRGRESLTALIAMPDALDQYLLQRPGELIDRPLEQLVVDPSNEFVGRSHLTCAAAELPLDRERDAVYLKGQQVAVSQLIGDGLLLESDTGGTLSTKEARPHHGVALRGSGVSFGIVDGTRGATIGTVDGIRTLRECHPGAIYLHAGRQYLVRELLEAEKKVLVEPVEVDYFTSALGQKETRIVSVESELHDGWLSAWLGRVEVTERVIGYERKRILGQERLDAHPLDLPPVQFTTAGLWWAVKPALETALADGHHHFLGSLHASEHAAISLFPLLAICDRGDIGGISVALHPQVGCGAVFIYDGYPGGAGIAAKGFDNLRDHLHRVEDLLTSCECKDGCPSCVQSPKCGNGNRPLDKDGARRCLAMLQGRETPELEPDPGWSIDLTAGAGAGGSGERQHARELLLRSPAQALPEESSPHSHTAPAAQVVRPVVSAKRRRRPRQSARQRRGVELHRLITGWRDRTLIVDVETLRSARQVGGWHRVHRMGLALAVVCFLEEDRFETFLESQVLELISALRSAQLVIGFNSEAFDFRVLAGYTGADVGRLVPSLDLMSDAYQESGVRRGLQHFASETLGIGKEGDGMQSLQWVREGRLDLVESYCRRDVEVTRDLYLFGRREGFLRYRNRKDESMELRVEW